MFENLIGQDSIRDQLSGALKNGTLPNSLLFSGEAHSGKLTTALELARAVTCQEGEARWDCSCRSCRDHRVMVNPDILLLGNRYFLEEIKASADLLVRTRAVFAVYMFIRNVRKLLKRFEPVIWEGMEKKLSRYSAPLSQLTEALETLDPARELPGEEELKPRLDEMINLARTLVPAVPSATPIDQIRNISKWAHLTSSGSAKIVILERADRLLESASNSLLKILEEPPHHVTFILLTERKGGIMPTIQSRVRNFDFIPRTKTVTTQILEKLFRTEEQDLFLYEFFQRWSDTDFHFLSEHVKNFTDTALTGGSITDLEELFQFFDKTRNKMILQNFLRLLSDEIRKRFREDHELMGTVRGQHTTARIMKLINQCHTNSDIYNQNSLFLLESLFYNTREIYEALC